MARPRFGLTAWGTRFAALLIFVLVACEGNTLPATSNQEPSADLANVAKPAPVARTFHRCPPNGDGGDRELNMLKNRIDTAQWVPVKLETLLALRWPDTTERRDHNSWSESDRAEIKKYEGAPVSTIGYLADAKRQGPESTNCHSTDDVDRHLWLVRDPGEDRTNSLVIEITPRVAADHPEWTTSALNDVVKSQSKVRISGWLLFDEEHPDQLGKTRGSLWEIHPVMKVEVENGNGFVELGK